MSRLNKVMLAAVSLSESSDSLGFRQAYAAAIGAGEMGVATEILIAAENSWAGTPAFQDRLVLPPRLAASGTHRDCVALIKNGRMD